MNLYASCPGIMLTLAILFVCVGCSNGLDANTEITPITPRLSSEQLTYRSPTWSNDDRQLAVVAQEVFNSPFTNLVIRSGRSLRNETVESHEGLSYWNPEWSPDDTEIVFYSLEHSPEGIWIRDLKTDAEEFLSAGVYASWGSSDRLAIADFESDNLDSISGSAVIDILDVSRDERHRVFTRTGEDIVFKDLVWSPNSDLIATVLSSCEQGGGSCVDSLIFIDPASETNWTARQTKIGYESVNWGPDSQSVSYVSLAEPIVHERTQVEVMGVDGSCTQWSIQQTPFGWPDWTSDGRKVAFVGTDQSIYLANTDDLFEESFWEPSSGSCE